MSIVRMKRKRKWVLTIGEILKVKKHTVVMIKQISYEKGIEEMEILSSNHLSIEETGKKKSQMKDAQKSPTSFEKGNQPINNTYKSIDQNGVRVGLINSMFLKRYFA